MPPGLRPGHRADARLKTTHADPPGRIADAPRARIDHFSAAADTTVGFGDLVPVGPIRLRVAIEALTGLVLITRSASFTLRMLQHRSRSTLEHTRA